MLQRDPKSPNWLQDIGEHQYVLVHVDLDNLSSTFEEVDDSDVRELLKSFYALKAYDKIVGRHPGESEGSFSSSTTPMIELSVATTGTESKDGHAT